MNPAPFHEFGDFRLIRPLGEPGSFGAAYEAERNGERCVVKIFHGELVDRVALARFQREVRAQQRTSHPNLIDYLDSGMTVWHGKRCHWISMRFLEGRTLRDLLKANGGRITPEEARTIGAQVAAGLDALHDASIVHRDLKPSNIFICADGRVVILDYGIALFLDYTSLTERGGFVGTYSYAAPEQLVGEEVPATDLYSLGAVLYESITGRVPFKARMHLELIQRIQNEDPEPPSSFSHDLPISLEQLILHLLEKQAYNRPRSAADVRDVLDGTSAAVVAAKPQAYDRSARPLLFIRASRENDPLARACATLCRPTAIVASLVDPTARREARKVAGFTNAYFAVDPLTYRFGFANFALSANLAKLAFAPEDGIEPFTPDHFRDLEVARAFAKQVVDEQLQTAAANLLYGASFVIRSIDDAWLTRTAKFLEESVRHRDLTAAEVPIYAPLVLAIDGFMTEDAQSRLVNKLTRAHVDGYVLMFDGLTETSPPGSIAAAIRLALVLQQSGRPVVVARAGALRHLFYAFGVAGVEVGLGRHSGFRLSDFDSRHPFKQTPPRFELPSLLMSASAEQALSILDANVLPETACGCAGCKSVTDSASRVERTVEHDAATYQAECDTLEGIPAVRRVELLEKALADALGFETELRRRGVLKGRLEHLQIWPKAIAAARPFLDQLERRRRAA